MISQRMMVGRTKYATWSYTINTEATTSGAVDGAVPINLYGLNVSVIVDWGDGTVEKYRGSNNWFAIVHSYSLPGIYQISIAVDKPELVYLSANCIGGYFDATYGRPAKIMRDTLVSVDTPLPPFAGVAEKNYWSNSRKYPNNFNRLFYEHAHLVSIPYNIFESVSYATDVHGFLEGCSSLSVIPSGLFDFTPNLTTIVSCFQMTAITSIPSDLLYNCSKNINVSSLFGWCHQLTSIPEDLLLKQTEITSLYGFLYDTTSLGTFSLNIYSPLITSIVAFCPQQNPSPNTRTIHVIPGSTTEATFNANASSYYLTIVPDIVV